MFLSLVRHKQCLLPVSLGTSLEGNISRRAPGLADGAVPMPQRVHEDWQYFCPKSVYFHSGGKLVDFMVTEWPKAVAKAFKSYAITADTHRNPNISIC